jgi:hypothetical protein
MRPWREPGWWLLAAVVLLFFRRPLTTETLCYRDLHLLFIPKKFFLVQAMGGGQIPLWDPLTHGGQPYLASPANTFYYPANLLYAVLPVLQAFNTIVVLHVVLCGWTAYLLARVLSLSRTAAFATGAVYALGGYTLSTINLMVLALALPWVPLTLAAAHRYVTSRSARSLVVASLSASLPLLAGAAELTAVMFATIAAWLAVVPAEVPLRRRAAALGLVAAFALGLSCAQTVPAAEMIGQSSRIAPRTFDDFARWSFSPRRIPELVVPRFFGPTDVADDTAYWGAKFESRFPYILSVYSGVVAMILAVVAVVATARDHSQRRIVLLLAGLAAAGLVLSLGSHLPLFRLVHEYVPGVRNFRYPVKALMLSLMPMALLAGVGVQRIEDGRLRAAALISGFAAIALLLLSGFYTLSVGFRDAFTSNVFLTQFSKASHQELIRSLGHSAAFATLAALSLLLGMMRRWHAGTAIAALVILDLAIAGARVNFYAPRSLFDKPPLADKAAPIVGEGRLYRHMAEVPLYRLPEQDPAWVLWWEIQTLRNYLGTLFGFPMIFHTDYDGMAPSRIVSLASVVDKAPWPAAIPLLARSGVTAVITRDEVPAPLHRITTIRDADGKPIHLYANAIAAPIRFAARPRYVSGEAEALAAVAAMPYESEAVILIGRGERTAPRTGCRSRILSRRRAINESVVEVETSCDGFVVFAETFYPGWKAYVDGRHQDVVRADYAFSAVAVPEGRHVIRKVYRPVAVPIGLAGSALALAGLIIVARRIRP